MVTSRSFAVALQYFGLVGRLCSKEFYRPLHGFGVDKNRFYSWRVALGKIIILKKKSFVRLEVIYVFMPGLDSFSFKCCSIKDNNSRPPLFLTYTYLECLSCNVLV